MAKNNTNNGANAPEESKKKKGFKEKAKDVFHCVVNNPVTKAVGKVLVVAGAIGLGAFIGGVGTGIREERRRSKAPEEPVMNDAETLPDEEAPAEEAEAEEAPEEAPVEEQAEE